jgi:hypothetical protein
VLVCDPDGRGDHEAGLAREGAEVVAETGRVFAVFEGVEVAGLAASAALQGLDGCGGVVGHRVRVAWGVVRA